MNDWLRRAASVPLSGVEALLALAVLGAVGMLFDPQTEVQSGAYNREAASGFVIGSFALWVFASVGLVGTGTPYGAFSFVLGASAVTTLGLLVHVAVDATRFARRFAAGG